MAANFSSLSFDNRFTQTLPGDPIVENKRRQVRGALYSKVLPSPVRKPQLLAYSAEVLDILGLDKAYPNNEAFSQILAGNKLAEGMQPYATCYGGHQFGNWAGQLGDGRAINLGEILNAAGERWALQLKGAGPTPYSRQADGLAVLRSSVREYLCSEAMHHLGVPTTRALSLITTGELVERDMLYDGNIKDEMGAVVCRVAPSFTRFGHFQILSAQDDMPLLKQFIEYTIHTDFPHLAPGKQAIDNQTIETWFTEVCVRTAEMIAHWMRVGFVHGVMNTDNMSILGLTIDYGPYGWLDNYDPDWTPNTTDAQNRRYRYANQPTIAHWNLVQLAQTIAPLTKNVKPLQAALDEYAAQYDAQWLKMMLAKLGITKSEQGLSDHQARDLIEEGSAILQVVETDMTIFFRSLASVKADTTLGDEAITAPLFEAYYSPDEVKSDLIRRSATWLREIITQWQQGKLNNDQRVNLMNAHNPKYVLRNYLAQQAIDQAEGGDYSMINDLQAVLKTPYIEQSGKAAYAEKRPDWAKNRAGCSMLSCSS